MLIDISKEEGELIFDILSYAENPNEDSTFWQIVKEDETEEEYNKLYELSKRIKSKLRRIK